ncbi:hypothetical protein D9M71_549320 [compost metagenome]
MFGGQADGRDALGGLQQWPSLVGGAQALSFGDLDLVQLDACQAPGLVEGG